MFVRVPTRGTGTAFDPVRVPLPHYEIRWINPAGTVAVVFIPDDEIADLITSLGPTLTNVAPYGPVVTALPAGAIATVLSAIRAKYPHRAGSYDLVAQ